MPEAAKWLALELGILAALIPGIITIVQWRRRRRLVQALEALSRQIKQAENERRRTLTGILAGAHHLQEAQSAEAANSLILSERGFFRQCFQVLLSQDPAAVENLSHNLYSVLDEYLRKCTAGEHRAAPLPATDTLLEEEPTTEHFDNLLAEAPSPPPIAVESKKEALDNAPPAEEEIDWDAAFAELHEEKTVLMPSIAPPPPSEPEPVADGFDQETMDLLLTAPEEEPLPEPEPPAAPEEPAVEEAVAENEEDDIMAQWGAALAEQAEEPPEPPAEPEPDSAIDLGWDDAFLEETQVIKPEQKAGGS